MGRVGNGENSTKEGAGRYLEGLVKDGFPVPPERACFLLPTRTLIASLSILPVFKKGALGNGTSSIKGTFSKREEGPGGTTKKRELYPLTSLNPFDNLLLDLALTPNEC